MTDREMALRFCAFRILGLQGYENQKYRAMEPFLDEATRRLDDPRLVHTATLDRLFRDFTRAMRSSYIVFGENAFRKWPQGKQDRSPFNRALFESWSIALTDLEATHLERKRRTIVEAARQLMAKDAEYVTSITTSTGDPRKVLYRFKKAADIVESA